MVPAASRMQIVHGADETRPRLRNVPYTFEHSHRNVVTVRCDGKIGTSFRFLLRSDAHHDNPKCDQALERRHLAEAVESGAGIIDAGDLFCMMQGKYDKRADKSACRFEHQSGDYIDAVIRTAAEFYQPFAHHFIVIGEGNHESAIRKRHETDPTTRLVERINTEAKSQIQRGGYGGWVRFMFHRNTWQDSRILHYYHGTGGGGPVTRGVIQTNRLAVFNPDADIVLTGHTHDEWILPITRQRLSNAGVPYHDEQLHVRTPGYKDAWDDGYGGWETERMLGPKPKGAAWLTFTIRREHIETTIERAK